MSPFARLFPRLVLPVSVLASTAFSPRLVGAQSGTAQPNVVLINIDDLGPAWLPPYANRLDPADVEQEICRLYAEKHRKQGTFDLAKHLDAAKHSMPFVGELASRGVVFDRCFATSALCAPSRSGLLTGRYQQRWGGYSIPDVEAVGIPAAVPCLVESFKQAGYECGLIGKWHVGMRDPAIWNEAEALVKKTEKSDKVGGRAVAQAAAGLAYETSCAPGQHPLDRGFDYYFGYNRHASVYYEADDLWENRQRVPQRPPGEFLTDLFNAKAVAFVEQALTADRRFFLYYAPMTVHGILKPPPQRYTSQFHTGIPYSDQYAGHLLALDEGIRKIFDLLKSHGQDRNTLFILTADNGQSLEDIPPYNAPYRGGKGSGWLGGSHEPLIVYWPGKFEARVSDALVSEMDILPTALAAAGLSAKAQTDGKSLLPLLRGETTKSPHDRLFSAGLHATNWSYPYFDVSGTKPHDERTCPLYSWELSEQNVLMCVTAVAPGVYHAFPQGRPAQTLFFDLKHDRRETEDHYASDPAGEAAIPALRGWLQQLIAPAAIHQSDYDKLLRLATGVEKPRRTAMGSQTEPTRDEMSDLGDN